MNASHNGPGTGALPKASIVVPTRGGRERLGHLLERLASQSRQDFEVIVVVDGDVDSTTSLLEEWKATKKLDLHAEVFPENRGRSRALNAGFAKARGEVLIRCDDDLSPADDYVEQHIRAHPGSGPTGAIGIYDNEYPSTPYARVYGDPSNVLFHQEALSAGPEKAWRYWAGNCSVNRAAHELVGEYDVEYRKYGWEDVDMGYRLWRAGTEIKILDCLTTPHHVAATTTRIRALRALHAGAARELFIRKHGEEALEGASDPSGAWGALVKGLATVMTEPTVRTVGGMVDALLPRVPSSIGNKLVALCVEASSRSGVLHPERARTAF